MTKPSQIPAFIEIRVPTPKGGIAAIVSATEEHNSTLYYLSFITSGVTAVLAELGDALFSSNSAERETATAQLIHALEKLKGYNAVPAVKDFNTAEGKVPALQLFSTTGEKFHIYGSPDAGYTREDQPSVAPSATKVEKSTQVSTAGEPAPLLETYDFNALSHKQEGHAAKAAASRKAGTQR